jgi:hypothetical protein
MTALLLSFPSPLVGEGRVGGREVALGEDGCKKSSAFARNLPTPTPNPSPTSLHSGARKRGPGGGGES